MINDFWEKFKSEVNEPDAIYDDVFHFEITEKWANELLRLVLAGKKKATSSSLLAYEIEGAEIPKAGEYSIVTDWYGNPHCVIKTINVRVIPYNELTFDIIKLEGEDDSLESWQNNHERFFKNEGKEIGYKFSYDMPVVFEEFEVVYKK